MRLSVPKLILYSIAIAVMTGRPIQAQSLKTAIQLTESEQFEQAGLMFKKLIQESPGMGAYYFYAGDNIMKTYLADTANISFRESADSAYKLYQLGNEKDPKNPMNLVGMGTVRLLEGDKTAGQNFFDQAMKMVHAKQPIGKPGTITDYVKAVAMGKIAEGYILSSKKLDTTYVLPLLLEAEKYDSKNPEIYIIHGDAYLAANDGNNAIIMYNKAKLLDPKSPKAIMRTGNLWYRNKAYLVALEYYQEATRVDSTFAPVYRELAKLYSLARQYDNSIIAYKKFLELSSNNLSAKIRYAGALMNAKQYEMAIMLINEIMAEDSSRNDLNRAMAYAYYETGQYDKGLTYIMKFFKKTTPDKIMTSDWIYYGKILTKNKQDSLAVQKFQTASVLEPDNMDVIGEMANCYSRMKNFPQAAELYEKLLKKEKPSYVDYYNLAKAYMGMKDFVRADSVLAIVSTLQPDFIPGLYLRASANANLDPETIEGRAKPFYESIIEKLAANPGKYIRELTSSYEYLAYYYLKTKDYTQSKEYYNKVLAIDPANKNAIDALEVLKKYK
jgi:tetratricopeptide (TPR) repeat protein